MMTDFLKEVGTTEVARDSLKIEVNKLGMHRSDTQYRYRLRSGHFLRIGYRRDQTDPNPILCVYYSVLLLSPTKAQKHYKAP